MAVPRYPSAFAPSPFANPSSSSFSPRFDLAHDAELLNAAIDSLPGVFYAIDARGRFLRWNKKMERVTGYSKPELEQMHVLALIAADNSAKVEARFREVFERGEFEMEAELLCKDGRRIPHLFSGKREITNAQPCLIGTGIDISRQRQAERQLQELYCEVNQRKQVAENLANDKDQLGRHAAELERRVQERTAKLQQSIQSLEGVLYHVAHDLRAPLRAMQGFTTILLEEYAPKLDKEGEDYAQRVSCAASRMDKLIQDLLAYGRLGHAALTVDLLDLRAEVLAARNRLASEIQDRNASVSVDVSMPPVQADSGVLGEILVNLLRNAITFVSPGMTPLVRVRAEAAGNGVVRIWIEDNGIGIDPDHHERVFRVFERLRADPVYIGTGIGLAIVRKGAERMGGNAGVESSPGAGSRFWVELPAAQKTNE